jgi:hypothetical protein
MMTLHRFKGRWLLEMDGDLFCATVAQNGRGRPGKEYWVNERGTMVAIGLAIETITGAGLPSSAFFRFFRGTI